MGSHDDRVEGTDADADKALGRRHTCLEQRQQDAHLSRAAGAAATQDPGPAAAVSALASG